MCSGKRSFWPLLCSLAIILFLMTPMAFAGEADIMIPDLTQIAFMGGSLGGLTILNIGLLICVVGMTFGWFQYIQTKNLPSHQAMLDVSNTIWETCKTYLFQQGKFLAGLWVLIAICIVYYFVGLQGSTIGAVMIILFCSVMGILGSYGVAWFGIRINTVANSRAAFASLSGNPLSMVNICLRSGMSVGLLLVSIELFFMILILAYIPKDLAGPCFIGFAIGESLGASALRICGGIFTKIADIGSDLMKIIFHLPEDDPKNPGVIADCTGDNAGDSVGPTADGFETYGVTGVALIAFLALALASNPAMGGKLIVWIFAMRILMILTSLASYFVN
ncbi:MAG: sodium/proton-translocating pyrophosphatase, partial [Syntrophales bacterium]|nr:sodium/proton-translocating pyrophosphatase [Syntrophales bacterium]